MTLQFWVPLQEAIYDPYVIPIQSNPPEDNNSNVLDFGNATSQQSPPQQVSAGILSTEEAQNIRDAAIILFKRLIEILRVKLQLPPEDEWNEWHEGKLEYGWTLFIDFFCLTINNITLIIRDKAKV